jgi:hypothetical protein
VWSASVDPGFTLSCPSPSVITAPESGTTTVNSTASVNNSNTLYGNTYSYSATNSRGWAMTSASGSVAAGALSSAGITIGLVVPDSAVSGTVDVCFTVVLNSGAKTVQCCTTYPVDHPVAVAATVVEATGSGSTARVSWWVGEAGPVTIERSRDGSVWTALDTRFPDGSQRVSYEDATVTPGHYSYRLAWTRDGSTRYAGQVWIEVSANVSFALRGVHPNPVMRDAALAVSFSLPDDAPATIEVLDLGGRRILQRGVGSMGAGSHVLRLTGTSQNLPSGLYIVRLSRAGKRLTSKFSVIQ